MSNKGKTEYYFPTKEAGVIPWSKNFVTVLAVNAERWGIAVSLVTPLTGLAADYTAAYIRRFLPDAGRVSVEQKTLALTALKKAVRDMVNSHINHNAAVTPDDRVALGLYVYKPDRSPVPDPITTVVLRIMAGLVRQLTVYFADSATPESRAKPYGVQAMELVWAVLPSPPASIDELIRSASATKSPLTLTFREEDRGKTVYMAGCWRNTRQKRGPWSAIVSAIIP